MLFASTQQAAGNKTTKLALVVVFHVILGIALVKTMNVKLISIPSTPAPVSLVPTIVPPVTEPPPSTLPVAQLPTPVIVAPMPDVPVPTPAVTNTVTTTTVVSEATPPAQATGTASAQPAQVSQPPAASGVRMAAMMDGCVKPAYPAQAARNGDTGTVTLALLIGVDGRVTDARVAHSSGFRDLDRAALTGLARCTFKPAMHGDVAEAGWAQIAFQWTLE